MEAVEAFIIKEVLEWLASKLAAIVAEYERDRADHTQAEENVAQDNDKASHINEGSKSDDIDSAIDDSLRHS